MKENHVFARTARVHTGIFQEKIREGENDYDIILALSTRHTLDTDDIRRALDKCA